MLQVSTVNTFLIFDNELDLKLFIEILLFFVPILLCIKI